MVCLPSLTTSMEHKLFPVVWNSDVTHQLRTNVQQGISEILAILEPRLVASFIDVLKPICVRELSPSRLLECTPQFGNHRIPMNSAVSFPLILVITTYQSHDQFGDFGLNSISSEIFVGKKVIPLPFFNMKNFF